MWPVLGWTIHIFHSHLDGAYKNMTHGIIALVFRCKITGGELALTDETTAHR